MIRIVKARKPGLYIRRRIYTNRRWVHWVGFTALPIGKRWRRWVGLALQIPAKPPQEGKRYTLHDCTGQKHRISYDPTRRNDLE